MFRCGTTTLKRFILCYIVSDIRNERREPQIVTLDHLNPRSSQNGQCIARIGDPGVLLSKF